MTLTRRNLTGQEYLSTVTDLLQRIRLEGALEGLYEAADLQWRWREDDAAIPERQQFWFDGNGYAVACLLRFDAGSEWSNDLIYLPSAQQAIKATVIPEVVKTISDTFNVSTIHIRDDDFALQRAVENVGFVKDAAAFVQTELASDPARTQLPQGFLVTTRVEDARPHHMIPRNGDNIAVKLRECSLYRPELDLCIRDDSGNVAAYVLFWMDDMTKVGLIEPVRTEARFQRLGLARHLIAEGIARLRDLGAKSIRVTYQDDNEAAANLYHRLGFVDRFKELSFRRDPNRMG